MGYIVAAAFAVGPVSTLSATAPTLAAAEGVCTGIFLSALSTPGDGYGCLFPDDSNATAAEAVCVHVYGGEFVDDNEIVYLCVLPEE